MKRNVRLLLTTVLLIVLNGCGAAYEEGGGGIEFSYVDNSELTSYRNDFGYFGYDVLFGEEYIVGDWILYDTNSYDAIFARFYDDGTVLTDNTVYGYGVSRDGLAIYISTGERIEIVTSHIYRYLEEAPCYRVEIADGFDYTTADMCPKYYE